MGNPDHDPNFKYESESCQGLGAEPRGLDLLCGPYLLLKRTETRTSVIDATRINRSQTKPIVS